MIQDPMYTLTYSHLIIIFVLAGRRLCWYETIKRGHSPQKQWRNDHTPKTRQQWARSLCMVWTGKLQWKHYLPSQQVNVAMGGKNAVI